MLAEEERQRGGAARDVACEVMEGSDSDPSSDEGSYTASSPDVSPPPSPPPTPPPTPPPSPPPSPTYAARPVRVSPSPSPPPLTPAAADPPTFSAVPLPPAFLRRRPRAPLPELGDAAPPRLAKRFAWPPLEKGIGLGFVNVVSRHPLFSSLRFPQTQGLKRVAWPPPPDAESAFIDEQQPVYAKGSEGFAAAVARSPPPPPAFAPVAAPRSWAPVPQPAPQLTQQQPLPGAGAPGQPLYPPQLPEPYQPYQPPVAAFDPPPATIALRPQPPVSQLPPPVFASQPAATRGMPSMRGDEKWPPVEYKARAQAENEARVALAKGPALRPRKVRRDYSQFFAQHALTSNYPAYRAPPGTQHYVEEGTSNF